MVAKARAAAAARSPASLGSVPSPPYRLLPAQARGAASPTAGDHAMPRIHSGDTSIALLDPIQWPLARDVPPSSSTPAYVEEYGSRAPGQRDIVVRGNDGGEAPVGERGPHEEDPAPGRCQPEVNPEMLMRIKRAKKVTKMSEKVATGILSGLVKVTGYFTSSVANSKAVKFFSLLRGDIVLAFLLPRQYDGIGIV